MGNQRLAINLVETMPINHIQSQERIVRKSMWPSFETAVRLYDYANILLILALVVGVVSTGLVVWMGKLKEGYLRHELAATNARAEEAKAASSAADAKAAELEKDAALARLETEKIKEAVAWRVINPVSASKLERVLSANPGSVNLRYMDGDPEALFLAIQVSKILSKSHWRIAPGAVKPGNAIVFGICLPDLNGNDAKTLRNAFSTARIPFATDALPQSGVMFSMSRIQGAPTLMIGSKAPALPWFDNKLSNNIP